MKVTTMNFLKQDTGDLILQEAVETGNLAQIQERIAGGSDVNQVNWLEGLTLLEIAIDAGQSKSVRLLLEAGANPNFGLCGTPPLVTAAGEGRTEIAKMLIKAGAKIDAEDGSALRSAATCGHIEMVRLLIEAGANVNAYRDNTSHPLFWAAFEGHQEVFDYLAPLTNPEQRQEAERSALFLAAYNGKIKTLEILFQAGTDLNSRDYQGRTPLIQAAEGRQPLMVEALLNLGAEVNARDNEGRTALMVAVQSRYITTVKILIHAGADINVKDMEGNTVLIYAEQAKDKVITKLLRDAGAMKD